MAEEKDPFSEFGGTELTSTADPFAEFGGTEVKKKVDTSTVSTTPASQPTTPSSENGEKDKQSPVEPIDLPNSYQTDRENYKDLVSGQTYKLLRGGVPIVGVWNAEKQEFVKQPLLDLAPQEKKDKGVVEAIVEAGQPSLKAAAKYETEEEVLSRNYLKSEEAKKEAATKAVDLSEVTRIPALQQLSALYQALPQNPKLQSTIDELKSKPISDEDFSGIRFKKDSEGRVYQNFTANLPLEEYTGDVMPMSAKAWLPKEYKDLKTIGEVYEKAKEDEEYVNTVKDETSFYDDLLTQKLISKLPQKTQEELAAIQDKDEYADALQNALVESGETGNIITAAGLGLLKKIEAITKIGNNIGLTDEEADTKMRREVAYDQLFRTKPKGYAAEISYSMGGMVPDILAGLSASPLMIGSMMSTMPQDMIKSYYADKLSKGEKPSMAEAKKYAAVSTAVQAPLMIGAGILGGAAAKLTGATTLKRAGELIVELAKRGGKDAVLFGAGGHYIQNKINEAYDTAKDNDYTNSMLHMATIGVLFGLKETAPQVFKQKLPQKVLSEIDYLASYLPPQYTVEQVSQLVKSGKISQIDGQETMTRLAMFQQMRNQIPTEIDYEQAKNILPLWEERERVKSLIDGATDEFKEAYKGQLRDIDKKIMIKAAVPLTGEELSELAILTRKDATEKGIDRSRLKYLQERKKAVEEKSEAVNAAQEKAELNKLQTARDENKAYDKDRLKVLEKRQEAAKKAADEKKEAAKKAKEEEAIKRQQEEKAAEEQEQKAETNDKENTTGVTPALKDVESKTKVLTNSDKKVLINNGFKEVDGMMINGEGERAWTKLSENTKNLLKKYGIHYIEGFVDFSHLKGGETQHGHLVKIKNGDARGIKVNVSSVGDKFNIENTILHELGHKVYEELDTDFIKQLEAEPITEHGKEVKKNVEDGGKTYKKEDIAEEDFAELFAKNKGDLKAVEELLGQKDSPSVQVVEEGKVPPIVAPQIQVEGKIESPYYQSLKKLGYSDNQISGLTYEQQQQIVDGRIEAPVTDIKEQVVKTDSRKEAARQERIAEAQRKLDEEVAAEEQVAEEVVTEQQPTGETVTETEAVEATPEIDTFTRASDKKIRMAELMDGSLDADIIPKTSKEEFTTITEKAIMPDGEDGVKVTLQKPDGEKVELGVMYPEDVETEVAKKIRGYKLQQAKPETTTEPQAEQPATDFTGKNVTFEHAGSDVTGVVVGTDEKGNLKVKDARGINYTVNPEKATTIDEITAAKNEFAEALKEFRDAADITKLGIKGTDPQAQAEAMYKIHKALVRMAKAYIAKGINDVKKFASAVGITAKQAQQAWDEAMGIAKYAAEDLAYDIADLTKTAIRRGINVREKFAEYKQQQKDFKKAISDFINDAEIKKAISPTQVRALVSRASKVTTEAQLDNFIDYAQKVIDNAEYSVEMDDIRDMQQKARKRNHVSFGNIVREFTSITPEKIPDNLLVAYKTALDGLMARVPSYKAMEEIFYEIAQANFKPDTFSNIQTYQQAQELYNQIALNKIGSIQEYRDLFKSINGFKRRVEQLFENGDITEDQRNDLIDQVGKDQTAVESKYGSEITSLKTDLINEIRAKQKSTGISQLTTEEKKLLEEFYKLDNNDLRSLSPEELYNLSSILDNVMEEGRVDVFRLSPLVNRAKAASEATQLQQQVAKAKPFQNIKKSVEEVVKKMGMTYSSFWENTLGLGAVNYGAFQKYVVAPMERAIGSYRRDVQEGYKAFNDLKKKYKVDTEEQMNKIGMIATYLREYGMSNDPKYKGKKDGKGNEFGTRDWFEFVLTDPETRGRMKTEEIEALQKLYDQLPKVNGKVSPEEVYNSFMANDGKFLSTNEMNFLKDAMDWRDKNMTGKQKYANELRGKPFEEVMFHIKRVRKGDTNLQASTPVEVSEKTGNVRIAAGSGKEVTNNELGAVETNFEKLFAETLEENARDYHITPMLQKQNDVMNKAKEGLPDDKKSYIEVMKKNLASAINNEFQDAEANRLVTNLLKARAAQVLIAPIRTIGEATAALVSYPLRSGNFNSYGELFKKRDAVTKLMKQSNSPFQNRVDLSRQFDVQKGNIKGEGWLQKASELFAALPERMGIEPVWMATFDAAFEKEAGVKFDRERYLNSPEYADKYNKAIEAAGAVADATYGQIAGSTTKAGSRREVKILPEAVTNNKLAKMLGIPESVQSKKTMGTLAAFMTGYPFREVEQVLKSGSALKEAIKGADYTKKDVAKTLMPPLGVALSAITYNYWQALSYQFSKMALGDEEEKEKAKEDIANLFTGRTAILETAATMLSTLGSRYSGFSRTAVSWLGALYYNLAEDEKDKQVAKDFVRNITYQDPFVLQMTKSGDVNRYLLKEKLAWQTAQAVPAFGIVVDNAAKAMEAIGGAKYLQGKIERGEVLTEPEKEALVLAYVAVNMGNGVAQLFGYGLPTTTINKMAKQILDKGGKETKHGSTRGSRF